MKTCVCELQRQETILWGGGGIIKIEVMQCISLIHCKDYVKLFELREHRQFGHDNLKRGRWKIMTNIYSSD